MIGTCQTLITKPILWQQLATTKCLCPNNGQILIFIVKSLCMFYVNVICPDGILLDKGNDFFEIFLK